MGSAFPQIATILNPVTTFLAGGPSAWRPPQWGRPSTARLTLTVSDTTNLNVPNPGSFTVYIFDGIMREDHEQDVVKTKNPVQNGAPITDHAYRMPARLVIEIAMSDSMQSFTAGQFSSATSRSVSAYQTLLGIQAGIAICQVSTRMRQYPNMLITSVKDAATSETLYGANIVVTFEEMINASAQQGNNLFGGTSSSALPQTTDTTLGGPTLVGAVGNAVAAQHAISTLTKSNVPGAGFWSSTNVNPANQLPVSATAQVLPLTPSPNHKLSVTLSNLQSNIQNTKLNLNLNFNAIAGFWTMNISDQTGAPIVGSVPLVTGAYPGANILGPYGYLGVGSAYVINASGTTQDIPDSSDLGTDFTLVWDKQAN